MERKIPYRRVRESEEQQMQLIKSSKKNVAWTRITNEAIQAADQRKMRTTDPYMMKSQGLWRYEAVSSNRKKEHLKTDVLRYFGFYLKRTRDSEKGFAFAALKNELEHYRNCVFTKFFCKNNHSWGNQFIQPHRKSNQLLDNDDCVLSSERPKIPNLGLPPIGDGNNGLVTSHYTLSTNEKRNLPCKNSYMIATSSSRYSSNDIVHNHYLEEAKKKTQEHSRNSRNFSDSKHFVCSTCQKCVFNANHDSCVTKFLKEVNSRAKVPSNKTTNRNKPVEQIRVATKPNRQIPTGHRFSIKRTSTVHEKTTSPRSCLRWQPTGRILKTVCLRWVPTGKIFTSSTTKVDSEPPNGSKEDITNQCESEQALDVSAGTLLSTADQASVFMEMTFEQRSSSLVLHQMTFDHNRSELGIQVYSNEQSSSKLVPKVVP
ncbi:hypothetical protein Tco_1072170 [Tanacetum coccineum]